MKVSNEAEVTESEIVCSMSAQLGFDVLNDTSDMVRTGLKDILQKVDLSGMKNWKPSLQKAAQQLINEFTCIFFQNYLDLGRTSIIKNCIKVNHSVSFKELYRHTPPGMCEEVKVHIQEMLDVGAIRPSNSLWASVVVLVQKKDGNYGFVSTCRS